MHGDAVLPAFEMDCRDWLVVTPEEAGLPDDFGGAPLLAVLSTAVIGSQTLRSVSAVITVGLLDDDAPLAVPPVPGCPAAEIVDAEFGGGDFVDLLDDGDSGSGRGHDVTMRYLVPSPDGQLALLAEFTVGRDPSGAQSSEPELSRRIEALMSSFRWAA